MTILKEYIDSHHIISIIGTAKNAGKTTVLNTIIQEYKGSPIAITSIGLDGEEIDTITNLPKPQIHVYKNTIIATAYDCIQSDFVVHEQTGMMTPLGEIVIVEALKDIDILVAGPSTKHEMIDLVNRLKKYHVDKILIDGALFRRSLASTQIADAIILSTGASYNRDISKVVKDTGCIVSQFQVEEVDEEIQQLIPNGNCVIQNDLSVTMMNDKWIHSNPLVLKKHISRETKYLYLQGALTDAVIQELIKLREQIKSFDIILNDSTHIVCSSNLYGMLDRLNINVKVLKKSHLLLVSYNPSSPYGYKFDNKEFKQLLEENIDVPCVNVIEDRK